MSATTVRQITIVFVLTMVYCRAKNTLNQELIIAVERGLIEDKIDWIDYIEEKHGTPKN